MWDLGLILGACADALRERARAFDAEHAPLGLDALDELAVHPLLAGALSGAGFGVLREQRYPAGAARTRRSEGDRCDIVLTEAPGPGLRDPLLAGTLFGAKGVDPDQALWLEVKVVGQFAVTDGVSRSNPGYSGGLLHSLMNDVRKLAAEPGIAHGAALLTLYTVDQATAQHDLGQWTRIAIEKGLPISSPLTSGFALTDRIGNGYATVALIQAHHM